MPRPNGACACLYTPVANVDIANVDHGEPPRLAAEAVASGEGARHAFFFLEMQKHPRNPGMAVWRQ
jgi:hypothetical protein